MATFFVEGLRHLFQIGTLVPSSRWLARAMTRSLSRNGSPRRILEVGPGTGAVTRMILDSMEADDELHLVEVNPSFCRHIETRVLRRFRATHPGARVNLHCGSIMSAPVPDTFDIVICTLPFRAFSPCDVRLMIGRINELLAEDGDLTYMHFAAVSYLKSPFVSRTRRRELRQIETIFRVLHRRYGGTCEFVALNVLPSFVHRLNKSEDLPAPAGRFAWALDPGSRPPPANGARSAG